MAAPNLRKEGQCSRCFAEDSYFESGGLLQERPNTCLTPGCTEAAENRRVWTFVVGLIVILIIAGAGAR